MITWKCELTDTFAGDANYSWVRRATFTMPQGASNLAVMRAAKRALDLSSVRCRVDRMGEGWELLPGY